MKKVIILFTIIIIVAIKMAHSQNAPVTTIGTVYSSASSITVAARVTGFTNIGSCNLKIIYDPAIVLATNVSLGSTVSGNLSTNIATPGVITLSWYSYPGITLTNNSIFFNIYFQKVNVGTSAITCQDDGYSCIFYDGSWNALNDSPYATYYKNGSVTVLSFNAPITTAPNISSCPGNIVSIPVKVSSFNNIGAISLTLSYDAQVLNYISAINNSGFPGLAIASPTNGTIIIGGFSSAQGGVTLPSNATLFTLNFYYLGGTTSLSWTDNGESCEYTGPLNSPILNDIPQSTYYINGSVNQTPSYTFTENHTITTGESFLWQGQHYTMPGTYYANYVAKNGCDSIYILNFTVTKILNIKLFLEGLYAGGNIMNQARGASAPEFGNGIADVVRIELHNAYSPYSIVYSNTNVELHTDGTVTIRTIPDIISDLYYIIIIHRNSIETWSNSPVNFNDLWVINYDFTNAATKAYGNNMKLMPGNAYAIYAGDATHDGFIDVSDMSTIDNVSTEIMPGYLTEDINGDGIVDVSDMSIIDNNSTVIVHVKKP
jgi:hypothetical protein